jgi:hypothetical protein
MQKDEYEKLGSYALIGLPTELYKKRCSDEPPRAAYLTCIGPNALSFHSHVCAALYALFHVADLSMKEK